MFLFSTYGVALAFAAFPFLSYLVASHSPEHLSLVLRYFRLFFSPPLRKRLNSIEKVEGLSLFDTSFARRDSLRPLNKTGRVVLFHWSWGSVKV